MKVDLIKILKLILRNFIKISCFGLIYLSLTSFSQARSSIIDNSQNAFGVTPLMSAVVDQDVNGVKFFARSEPAYINQQNIGGATALHLAARGGNLEIINILLSHGADLNIRDNEGWTSLMRATIANNSDAVILLLTNDTNASLMNNSSESIIYHAATVSCISCLKESLQRYDFKKNMGIKTLKSQINISYEAARNKEDKQIQDILTNYLESITKPSQVEDKELEKDKKFSFSKDIADEQKTNIKDLETPVKLLPIILDKSDKQKDVIKDENLENPSDNDLPAIKKLKDKKYNFLKDKDLDLEKKSSKELPAIPKAISFKNNKHIKRFIITKGSDKADKNVDIKVDDKIEKIIILNDENEILNEVEVKDIDKSVEIKEKKILFNFNKIEDPSKHSVEIQEIEEVKPISTSRKIFNLKKVSEDSLLRSQDNSKDVIVEENFEKDEISDTISNNVDDDIKFIEVVSELEKTNSDSNKVHKKDNKKIFSFKKEGDYFTKEVIEEDYNKVEDLVDDKESLIKDDDSNNNKRYYFIPSR